MKLKLSQNLGVTLIELILVTIIISMLAAIAIATINPFEQFKKTNDAKRKSDLAQIRRALETYYQDYGSYPRDNATVICDASETKYQICDYSSGSYQVKIWGGSWTPYMNTLPKDPNPGQNYIYKSSSDQQRYWLFVSLERGSKDPQVCVSGGGLCLNAPLDGDCKGLGCNYGVSSPNTSP